jgi:glycosyltransferase 2 family protein
VIRSYILRRRENVPMGSGLATVFFVERIFDGVIMLLFVFIALPFTPMESWLRQIVIVASVAFIGALVVFFAVAMKPQLAQRIYVSLIDRLVPARFRERTKDILDHFVDGLQALRSPKDVLMIFVTSLVLWLAETVKYWFVMHAFDFVVPFYVLMLMNGVMNLATIIPSAPGYVGTFDWAGIQVLISYRIPQTMATAYTLVLHGALWFPITALGAYYMWKEQVSWRDFNTAAAAKQSVQELVSSTTEAAIDAEGNEP